MIANRARGADGHFSFGEHGAAQLLILSQVILSLQLSFAVFPLVRFTSDRLKMGEFVNPLWLKVLAYFVAFAIGGIERLAARADLQRGRLIDIGDTIRNSACQLGRHEVDEGPHLCRKASDARDTAHTAGTARRAVGKRSMSWPSSRSFCIPSALICATPDTRETSAEDRAGVGEEESPRRRHLDQLPTALELPRKGLPRHRVAHLDHTWFARSAGFAGRPCRSR